MVYCYAIASTRTHVLYLEKKISELGVVCELAPTPVKVSKDICNLCVRFSLNELQRVINAIKWCSLPKCTLFKENETAGGVEYTEIFL